MRLFWSGGDDRRLRKEAYDISRAAVKGFFPDRVRDDGLAGVWVTCAHCGHHIRTNQRIHQLRHSLKHRPELPEFDVLRVGARAGVDLSPWPPLPKRDDLTPDANPAIKATP